MKTERFPKPRKRKKYALERFERSETLSETKKCLRAALNFQEYGFFLECRQSATASREWRTEGAPTTDEEPLTLRMPKCRRFYIVSGSQQSYIEPLI